MHHLIQLLKQRFDGNGRALWNDEGLLVADRSFSSTEDYGLAVTPDGDAVLAYRGSGGSTTAMATRVDASGTIEWTVEAGSGPVNAPAIAVASKAALVATLYSGVPAVMVAYSWFLLVELEP